MDKILSYIIYQYYANECPSSVFATRGLRTTFLDVSFDSMVINSMVEILSKWLLFFSVSTLFLSIYIAESISTICFICFRLFASVPERLFLPTEKIVSVGMEYKSVGMGPVRKLLVKRINCNELIKDILYGSGQLK